MRKMMLALVTLLSVVGVGRAGDKEIIEWLKAQGVAVCLYRLNPDDGLAVSLKTHNFDAALAKLCELRSLRHVGLHHPGLTDAQLQQVCALPGLKSVGLVDCPITDTRLKIVARVQGLEELGLSGTAITDAGLAELTRLRYLDSLYLAGTDLTDAGMRHLEGMRGLYFLDLRNCPKVTAEGVSLLQKALPNCKIER
jgi:hypothetical protein